MAVSDHPNQDRVEARFLSSYDPPDYGEEQGKSDEVALLSA
jgi:hypothetical protein